MNIHNYVQVLRVFPYSITMNPIAYLDTHIGYASRSFQVQGFRSAPSQTLREGWIRHKMILLYATGFAGM